MTPHADFELFKNIAKEIDEKLLGITTSNGIFINSTSKHLVNRVIGSIEQRRNGVDVDKIAEVLTNPERIQDVKMKKTVRLKSSA